MKKTILAAAAGTVVCCLAASSTFPLEWHPSYGVAVPYEVEIQPAKIGKPTSFAVTATTAVGAKQLEVATLPGRVKGAVRLRFRVPEGTTALMCTADDSAPVTSPSAICPDNLFADAFMPANIAKWKLPKGGGVTAQALSTGGIALRGSKQGSYYVTYSVPVPPTLAGQPVAFELDVVSRTKMTWGGQITLFQMDQDGKTLPEAVVDPRWTGHMRPCDKAIAYREPGRLHPEARRVYLQVEMRGASVNVDEYGLPLSDKEALLPKLDITHLALRPAADLPFPKYNDAFFAPGVSGEATDTAFNFRPEQAFWYQTRSQASWAQATQLRKESAIFFPSAGGTVEAWFKADALPAQGARLTLFNASHHQANVPVGSAYKESRGNVMAVFWSRAKGEFWFTLKDAADKVFEKTVKADLPVGRWFHLAAAWTPGGNADLFLDGHKILTFPVTDYQPYDLVNAKCPNDYHCTEFYFGCHRNSTRFSAEPKAELPHFPGAGDLLRVSTGARYMADFTPARHFTVDADTRALFTFDRTFEGRSGGGIAWIPGTVLAKTSRVARRLTMNGRSVQYWPPEILPENHHDVVLNRLNYPVMPTVAEFRSARVAKTATSRLAPGGEMKVEIAAPKAYTDFIEYVNDGAEPLVHPLLINKGEIDPRSFGDIADSLGVGNLSDRDRANAVFNFVLGASDYFMSHQSYCTAWSDEPRCVEYQALEMLNSYCGFECGPLNNLAANMFAASGRLPASQTGGYGHSFEEVFYDGKNHIYDLSAQKFFPAMDNETAAYLAEDENEPGIHNRLGAYAGSFIRNGTRGHYVQTPAFQRKVAMTLNPGERFKVWFANDGTVNDIQHNSRYCGNRRTAYHIANRVSKGHKPYKEFEYECAKETGLKPNPKINSYYRCADDVHVIDNFFPHYGNGFISFAGTPDAANPAFCEVKADSFCYLVQSCYPVVAGEYAVTTKSGAKPAIEISTNRKDFDKVGEGLAKVDYRIRSRNIFLVRVKAPLADVAAFRADTEVMVNPRILPGKLKPGANVLTFKATKGPVAKITVGWREPAQEIVVSDGVYTGTIPGYERQVVLVDPAKELVLDVAGVSPRAKAVAHGALAATLANGKLTLRATAAEQAFAAVDIVDGEALKQITAIISANARLLLPAAAKLRGGARLVAANKDMVQSNILMKGKADWASFDFEALPAGEYVLLNVSRYMSHPTSLHYRSLAFKCNAPAFKEMSPCAGPANDAVNFFKAHYGTKGGRAAWRWDFPIEPLSEYPYHLMRYMPLGGATHMDFMLREAESAGVEFAAALVLPAPTRAFKRELMKVLCGLNCEPWRVTK